MACHRDIGDSYRPTTIPTSSFSGHLHGLTFQHRARHVRAERVFAPGSVVTVADGVLTKHPLSEDVAIRMPDSWFFVPSSSLQTSSPSCFLRGVPLGSFVRLSNDQHSSNVVFTHLPNDNHRVWMRCRESSVLQYVRPIGVVAIEFIDRSQYLLSQNVITQPLSLSPLDFTQMKARHYAKQNALSLGSVTGHRPNASLSLASVTGADLMGVEDSGREDLPVSVTDSDQNNSLVRTVPHPPQLSFSSYLLLLNHKTHNHVTGGLDDLVPSVALPVTEQHSTHHADSGADDSDIVDYEPEDYVSQPVHHTSLNVSLTSAVVDNWRDYDIHGLKSIRNDNMVAALVKNIISVLFDEGSNQPKPGLFWSDLFSQDVQPLPVKDPISELTYFEYKHSTRAVVPLLDWVESGGQGKFLNHPVSEDLVTSVASF